MVSAKKKSNAEAMRRSRLKMKEDPQKYQEYLQTERERYKKRKAEGKILDIKTMQETEQRRIRRKWRIDKRKDRQRKADVLRDLPHTPPDSPTAEPHPGPSTSRQSRAGRKRVKRQDRKAYRTIANQDKRISQLRSKLRAQQRLIGRLVAKQKRVSLSPANSPASKANRLIKYGKTSEVKRELMFSFALGSELKKKLTDICKRRKEKNLVRNVVVGPILRKYRLLNKAKSNLAITERQLKAAKKVKPNSVMTLKKKRNSLGMLPGRIEAFFLRDDVSRSTAGKKETITKHKERRQKRFLCDTMKNIYSKFKEENPTVKVSYTTFTRLRPFHVVTPQVDGRNTVQCKTHENAELKAKKMHVHGILTSQNINDLIANVVCDPKIRKCMFGECEVCPDINKIYKDESMKKSEDSITWMEWQTVTETRQTNKGEMVVKLTKKLEKQDLIKNLCHTFEEDFKVLMKHCYKMQHQYSTIQKLKQQLGNDEIILQIDFSENYNTKASTEIQAMHFGASRAQIALHTCHLTFKSPGDSNLHTKCYCTTSADTRHNAPAVWAHLQPVLDDLAGKYSTIHFISDGPTSQYKNRANFILAAHIPFQKKFKMVYWNFLESSHGKGPADGIGAAVKNAADRIVAHGQDILSCDQLMETLNGKLNVQLYQISSQQIDEMAELADSMKPQSVKDTMTIRQLIIPSPGLVHHRYLSCYCTQGCKCYNLKTVSLKSADKTSIQNPHSPHETLTVPDLQNKAVASIEMRMSQEQQTLFRKRFDEGYDVVPADLSQLTSEEQQEYILWTAWRAAMHSTQESKSLATSTNDLSSEEESESDSEVIDPNWKPTSSKCNLKENTFYAVVFLQSRAKKVFYIGRLTHTPDQDDGEIQMTFLERKMINAQYQFDWPRRRDECFVSKLAIIKEVNFSGPPPYFMTRRQNADLERSAKLHNF